MQKSVQLLGISLLALFSTTSCEVISYLDNEYEALLRERPQFIDLEKAQSESHLTIHFENRTVHMDSEWFSSIEWNSNQHGVWYGSYNELPEGQSHVVRSFMHEFPADQTIEYHYEAFGLQFRAEEDEGVLDSGTQEYLTDELFEEHFIQLGVQDSTQMRFLFWQSYVWGLNKSLSSEITVDKITRVSSNTGQLFVEGRFNGDYNYSYYAGGPIVAGEFAIIVSN